MSRVRSPSPLAFDQRGQLLGAFAVELDLLRGRDTATVSHDPSFFSRELDRVRGAQPRIAALITLDELDFLRGRDSVSVMQLRARFVHNSCFVGVRLEREQNESAAVIDAARFDAGIFIEQRQHGRQSRASAEARRRASCELTRLENDVVIFRRRRRGARRDDRHEGRERQCGGEVSKAHPVMLPRCWLGCKRRDTPMQREPLRKGGSRIDDPDRSCSPSVLPNTLDDRDHSRTQRMSRIPVPWALSVSVDVLAR